MKKVFFIAALLLNAAVFAQTEKYTAAMKANIAAIGEAFKSPAGLQELANKFERIATAEKTQWLPYYYAAFCQVNSCFITTDKTATDPIADKATTLINQAAALSPGNSEISVIKSMIATAHLMVDPMSRYMKYGAESSKYLEEALKQDPTNPRPEYLSGQSLKYTPEQFGGGCKTAVVELQKAVDKFSTFKPAGELFPDWGKEQATTMLEECKK